MIRLLPRAEVLQEVLLGRLTAAKGQVGSGHAYGWPRPWAGDGDGLGAGYGWGPGDGYVDGYRGGWEDGEVLE